MNTAFTFPRPQVAVPRQQAPKAAGSSQPNARESNALRASVLDAALELGIGSNPLVADWMFNNALVEEDEEEDHVSSPSLTYGSSATSEESSFSVLTSSSSISSSKYSGAGAPFAQNSKSAPRMDGMMRISESETDTATFDSSLASSNTVASPEVPIPPRPVTPASRKLKKKQKGDGYESDGGYISEAAGKKKDKKKAGSKDAVVFPSMETAKEAKKREKEEKKELVEVERKKKKSLMSAVKASKKAESKEVDKEYDTDGGGILSSGKKVKPKKSKSKLPSEDMGGYETDGAVKKSKTRFFKLSNKASRPDLRAEVVPAMPMPMPMPKEVVPLPIAERFATTLSPTPFSPTSPTQTSVATPPPVVSLPPGKVESPSAPLPPLAFQPFAPPTPSSAELEPPLSRVIPPSPILPATDRSSHASSESSSSAGLNPRRLAGNFSPSSSSSHGQGSGSHSTLTSNHAAEQSYFPANGSIPSPPNSAGLSGGPGHLKPPSISYPNTRSVSPVPSRMSPLGTLPVAPLQISRGLRVRPSLENMGHLSRENSSSPMPISPISPFMSTPLRSAVSSPTLGVPPHSYSSAAIPADPSGRLRSRSPAGSPGPPRNTFVSPPNSASDVWDPKPSQLTIYPSDYVVPSPRNSGLPSPNVLAYYDIPPPSPPPMGPLPTVPPQVASASAAATSPSSQTTNPGQFPSAAVLRQRVIDRTPRQLPPDVGFVIQAQSNIQRGKESPFPSRAVVPSAAMPVTGTRRYRDFYPQGAVSPEPGVRNRYDEDLDIPKERHARFRDELSWINTETGTRRQDDDDDDDDVIEYEGADDDIDESAEDLQGVLDRFEDHSSESDERIHPERALERSHSPEMLKGNHARDLLSPSGYYGSQPRMSASTTAELMYNRESQYTFEDDGRTVGDRTSRWSGSIYSRASILDAGASGETRERLVKQVEEMLEKEAKQGGVSSSRGAGTGLGYIPPVPRLPDAYANSNMVRHVDAGMNSDATPARSWNRF